jgi:NADH-quinone oxidoreductase subunit J
MMFFDATQDIKEDIGNTKIIYGLWIASAVLIVIMISAPFVSDKLMLDYPVDNHLIIGANNPQAVGIVLFTKYLVQFELAAVMLLVAMIAGIVLVSKKMDESLTLHPELDRRIRDEFDVKENK